MRNLAHTVVLFLALGLSSVAMTQPAPDAIGQQLADAISTRNINKINVLTEGRIYKPKTFESGANPFSRVNLITASQLIADVKHCTISQIVGPNAGDKDSYIEWKCANKPSPKGECYDSLYSGTIYQNRLGGYLMQVAETSERSNRCGHALPPPPINPPPSR